MQATWVKRSFLLFPMTSFSEDIADILAERIGAVVE
jgi:hypothetical protein